LVSWNTLAYFAEASTAKKYTTLMPGV